MIETIIKLFGIAFLMIGIFILSSLQVRLSRKLNKSLLTFAPVLILSSDKLSLSERQKRKIGFWMLVIGVILIVMMNSNELIDSFKHFNDPPEILMK
jgi:uncharacterized protein YjeT (DUF2065 family)